MRSLARNVSALPRPAWILFAGTFINKFGNFLSIYLVLYLTGRGYSAAVAGAALGIVGAGNFIGNGIGGAMADRLGRRAAIAFSMFGSGICTMLVPLAGNIVLLLLLVGATGIFAQLYRPAAGAALLDVVRGDMRATAFAVYRLAINAGMAAGPIVGGILSDHSYMLVFAGDALSSVSYGVMALTILPETAAPHAPVKKRNGRASGYRAAFRDKPFVLFLAAMVAATYIYVQSTATLPLQVRDAGLPNSFYGLLLAVNAVIVIAFELAITQVLKRRPVRTVVSAGLALLGLGFGTTAFAHSRGLLILTVLIWTLAEMIIMPSASAYPGCHAAAMSRGRYQAAFGLAQTVGSAAGPLIGGCLYARSPALNWGACAIAAAVGIIFIATAKPGITARMPGGSNQEKALIVDDTDGVTGAAKP